MSDAEHNTKQTIQSCVEQAAGFIEQSWPLYSFVTSNPLSGVEDEPFPRAIETARGLFGVGGYPPADQFRHALENGSIDRDQLRTHLKECGYDTDPETLLDRIEQEEKDNEPDDHCTPDDRRLNQIVEKWLTVFLDEGRARWSMPGRENGFYSAWRALAPMDYNVDNPQQLHDLPPTKFKAIENVLEDVSPDEWTRIFTYHLTELPGWAGYIKQRANRSGDDWANAYPIDLTDYLAVRLVLARQLNATVVPDADELEPIPHELDDARQCFLKAWEDTYRTDLIQELDLNPSQASSSSSDEKRPDAQFVFCIDTRSEIIRRHIESTGDYETHGYAGFFGIPVRRSQNGKDDTEVNACPPVVDPVHRVTDMPLETGDQNPERYKQYSNLLNATKNTLKKLKKNVLTAFSFVELGGVGYGIGMIGKTLFPHFTRRMQEQLSNPSPDYEEVHQPRLEPESEEDKNPDDDLENGLSLEDRVSYAESAFQLMGWDTFAPVVVFAGHVSETSNNPFDSSLCCGACAGNSGVPNAKMLARICNDPAVREELETRGIDIPDDTVFVAGKHNTTTDNITLYDDHVRQDIPGIENIKSNLTRAQRQATDERASHLPDAHAENSVEEVKMRAADWAQTRPEWGLSGNASFIIGPNELRQNADLEGRAFLHSYDWRHDPDGSALEQIIAGPLVVCQWINHSYFFSTVDTALYGSGTKITHNPVGNFGVLQGNGGDLMGGLPLQSVKRTDHELQHEPIRLQNIIHAPFDRVRQIVESNDTVRNLIENDWITLTVVDPRKDNEVIRLQLESDPDSSETEETVLEHAST